MPQKQTRRAHKNKKSIKLLFKDTYLAMIRNACGSVMWSRNYALVNGKKQDLVDNGNLSCAFFVSSILKIFDLISELHLTTKGLEKDLIRSGWQRIPVSSNMPSGSVLIWAKKKVVINGVSNLGMHYHSGFYLGKKQAVSIWSYHNFPIIHHWTYNNSRKIIRAYCHPRIKD